MIVLAVLFIVAFAVIRKYALAGWSLVAGIGGATIIVGLVGAISNAFAKYQNNFFIDRLNDPYEFQCEFNKILNYIRAERSVVVFDHVDLVSQDVAAIVLKTIKTFLTPIEEEYQDHRMIFVLPGDKAEIMHRLDRPLDAYFSSIVEIPG